MTDLRLTWDDVRRVVQNASASLEDHDPGLPRTDLVQMHFNRALDELDRVSELIRDRKGWVP